MLGFMDGEALGYADMGIDYGNVPGDDDGFIRVLVGGFVLRTWKHYSTDIPNHLASP